MLRALVYLRVTSLKNWVLWRVRRLRQPKYLAGTVAAIAYFYFFFFRHVNAHPRPHQVVMNGVPVAADLPAQWQPIALAIGALVLLVILTFMWVVPVPRAALGFSEAEIAFLFPAPITRRALVHFRLITGQLRSLAGGLIMALVSNRWSVLGGNAVTHAFGWWFIFSTLNLHFSGANFTLTRLADRGFSVIARRALVLLVVVAIVGLTLWRLSPAARVPAADGHSEFWLVGDWLVAVTTMAPLAWLLLPLRLAVGPFLAADTRTFLLALGPGLLVIAIHYWWVVKTAVSFEEGSIEHAEKRAAQVAAWRSGEGRFRPPTTGRKPAFRLRDHGRPEIAFLWKNLLSTLPYLRVRPFAYSAGVIVVASAWVRHHPDWQPIATFLAFFAMIMGIYLLIIGPQFARQDIRNDFNRLDILKTYPLPGWQIVLGEILAPVAILTGLIWLLLLTFALNVPAGDDLRWLTPQARLLCGGGIAVIVPPVVMLQLLVPNAAALVFPSWTDATRTRGGGPEVMGQRMIYFFAQVLTMIVALLPAALFGGAVLFIVHWFANTSVAVACASIPVIVILIGEAALGVWWLGHRIERLDVSAELRS